MAFKISEDCVSCGACASQCPVEAIEQGETKFEIDPEKCVSCGQCAEVCPVSAISEE